MQEIAHYIRELKKSTDKLPGDIWGMLRHPVKTSRNVRKRSFYDVLVYVLITAIVYAVFFGLMTLWGLDLFYSYNFLKGHGIVPLITIIYLMAVASTFFNAGFIHVFVIIVEGKRGIFESFKVVAYASTPSYILGWIPVFGIIAGIWALVVQTLALRELQEISTGRAVIAMVLPYIMFICIFISLMLIPTPYPILLLD